MKFKWTPEIGEQVRVTKKINSLNGYFDIDDIVTVSEISDLGYNLTDSDGNTILHVTKKYFCRYDFTKGH